LATALRDQGLVDEAIAAYRKVVAIGGRQATIFHSLGSLLSAQQCKAEAAEVFEQWLEWDPENPVERHMLAANRQAPESAPPARASDAYVEAIFDGFAPKFDKRLAGLEYRAPELVAGALSRRVGSPAASLFILDVGCGTGLCGPLLRPYARKLVGVDLSASMLALARERGGYDALFKEELTRYLLDTPERFDVIIAADTLVYFGDLPPVLRAASRALAPGGSLIATLEKSQPDDESAYRLNGHGRYSHSETSLRSACVENGLSVCALETVVLRMEMAKPVEGMLFCVSNND
jgi:predicted TPR repeat methyltransferase